jgi:acetylornithine/succinyldiaminopimelate/putrescine aminotransferase
MSATKQRVLDLAREHLMPHRVDVWRKQGTPLVIGRREGYRVWDLDGHELIDLHLNGGTYNLGHRHPALVETLRRALDEVDVGNHHFPNPAAVELARRLAELTPGDLRYTVFATSGGEAIDVAIKAARHATGRRVVVGVEAGYHGRTGLSGAVGDARSATFFHSEQPGDFVTVPFDDAAALERALATREAAAFVLETVPATMGFPIPSSGYMRAVRELCTKYGAMYVADEVQTGLGRTGPLWGVEAFGVEPDVLVTGKGISGGLYPIAAAVLSARVGGFLRENGWAHVATFGGAELGCRVALAVLDLTLDPTTRTNAGAIAERYTTGLRAIAAEQPFLRDVRQLGLVMGLRTTHANGGVLLSRALYDEGVWAMYAGFDLSVIQWKPGLLMDAASCDLTLARLSAALKTAQRMGEERDAAITRRTGVQARG